MEIVTVEFVMAEVREYLPVFAAAVMLEPAMLFGQLAMLAITVHGPASYEAELDEAARRIKHRDPDDVPLLALALALKIPVWSNDSDFKNTGIQWLTTARLLKILSA